MVIEVVGARQWVERAESMRAEGWVMLDLAGLDRLGLDDAGDRDHRFEIVCQFVRRDPKQRTSLHVKAEGDPPTIPTVTHVWSIAPFAEREAFDMYGIHFEGHEGLSRILMPDEWSGHPLRRDYGVGKIAIDFKPQPFLQTDTPGQSTHGLASDVELDALGQIKPASDEARRE